jgi:hypothetical protein
MTGTEQATYATDGTDIRGVVRHHYAYVLKRFVKYFVIFAPLVVVVPVFKKGYLIPLGVVGAPGVFMTVIFLGIGMNWIWKCSRVLRTYPLVFREPVEKEHVGSGTAVLLRMGERGAGRSPVMAAKVMAPHSGWPTGIERGVWFAGDDTFGGVALVPGSGELLFMQPREFKLTPAARRDAGDDRRRKARKAGIGRHISFQ